MKDDKPCSLVEVAVWLGMCFFELFAVLFFVLWFGMPGVFIALGHNAVAVAWLFVWPVVMIVGSVYAEHVAARKGWAPPLPRYDKDLSANYSGSYSRLPPHNFDAI